MQDTFLNRNVNDTKIFDRLILGDWNTV